jgi:ketosteroid isomerase-like protein
MPDNEFLQSLFHSIDTKDSAAFQQFLAPDCTFRLGNLPAVTGREAIGTAVAGFFASLQSLSHTLAGSWHTTDSSICHGSVCYTRHDGSQLTVPFANILKREARLISEYQVFVDISGLQQAA